ncbi:BON domain-containing protein [Caballeronia sordidicola]|uniref:Putative periplasmic or secreted lipoprotein n=1 Tax=Caballeronia sordidicola TaxID=196367 RepID=A0A226WNP2_CABSO|nr:BON domain-containing protein [Caballeronia sordidicola]OXC72723.1 putative periplasmic or secreted lipoprotein [Caballeronia sordidicola]
MQILKLTAVSSLVAFMSTVAMAQTSSDATTTQSGAPMTKMAVRAHNKQLSKAVRHSLYSTKGLVASNIAVLVKGGTVSLVGTVPDAPQIQMAADAAKRVPQVETVDNRLTVEEEGGQ